MKTHAVIDTNVIISALISRKNDTATIRIMDKLFDEEIIPLYNQEILKEYKEVMSRPKFHLNKSDIDFVISSIIVSGVETEPTQSDTVFTDQKDIKFYEVFLSVPDAYLITGNLKHFPENKQIISPARMIAIMG